MNIYEYINNIYNCPMSDTFNGVNYVKWLCDL